MWSLSRPSTAQQRRGDRFGGATQCRKRKGTGGRPGLDVERRAWRRINGFRIDSNPRFSKAPVQRAMVPPFFLPSIHPSMKFCTCQITPRESVGEMTPNPGWKSVCAVLAKIVGSEMQSQGRVSLSCQPRNWPRTLKPGAGGAIETFYGFLFSFLMASWAFQSCRRVPAGFIAVLLGRLGCERF